MMNLSRSVYWRAPVRVARINLSVPLCLCRITVKNLKENQWTCVWILSDVKNTPNVRGAKAQAAHAPPAENSLLTNPLNTRSPSKSYKTDHGGQS